MNNKNNNIGKSVIDVYMYNYNKYVDVYGKEKTILFMQVGSFFEAYSTCEKGPDLHYISKITTIICTRKDKNIKEISMKNPYLLGFPTISQNKFVNILTNNGFTVILMDQIIDNNGKIIRKVNDIVSHGTNLNNMQINDSNYIMCIYLTEEKQKNNKYITCSGISAIDITTGVSYIHEAIPNNENDDNYGLEETSKFINCINPKEIIIYHQPKKITKNDIILFLELDNKFYFYNDKQIDKKYFEISYQNEFLGNIYANNNDILSNIEYLDMERQLYSRISFVLNLDFIYNHNNKIINNINKPIPYFDTKYMNISSNAMFQLNIIEYDLFKNNKIKSLLDIIDNTSTAMGKRYIKNAILLPMVNKNTIEHIYIYNDIMIKNNTYINYENLLKNLSDLERLNRKISLEILQPCELEEIIICINISKDLCELINTNYDKKIYDYLNIKNDNLKDICNFMDHCKNIFNINELNKNTISCFSSSIFNKNVNKNIDELQNKILICDNYIDELCCAIKKILATNKKKNKYKPPLISITKEYIKSKDKYLNRNKNINICNFMYNIILSKNNATYLKNFFSKNNNIEIFGENLSTHDWIYKDGPSNKIKIIISNLDNKFVNLDDEKRELNKLVKIEYISQIKNIYTKYNIFLENIIRLISFIDFIKSNAKTAIKNNYNKPIINYTENKNNLNNLICKKLRHPIIEKIINHEYIPHDICFNDQIKGILLYGLNSSGKSSLMKALGINLIMAQAGMYVAAEYFEYIPFKNLFTRITGNDNIFKGLSSFALEMIELRNIINKADEKSLIIGDEICRGTEYMSGNAIVASTIIELSKRKSCFIFATHLHDICKIDKIKNIKNIKIYHLSVSYDNKSDTLIFDRQLKEGQGDNIYGITVAKYIIKNENFINLAIEIKNELLNIESSLIPDKKSKYNKKIYIYKCMYCNNIINNNEQYDTHHINHQKNCENNVVKDKKYINKNSKINLVVLCKKCHNKVHDGNIQINGYIMTSNGIQLH
jgi:DNA mismatch repair protein MutS